MKSQIDWTKTFNKSQIDGMQGNHQNLILLLIKNVINHMVEASKHKK